MLIKFMMMYIVISLVMTSVRYGPKELLRQIGYCIFRFLAWRLEI